MDATLETALAASSVLIFHAFELVLPSATIRLFDGSAAPISFTVDGVTATFAAEHASFGSLDLSGVQVQDGDAAQAPSLQVTIKPPTEAAAGDLLVAATPGSAARLWLGVLSRSTGQPVGAPELIFAGELDVPTLQLAQGQSLVTLEIGSVWDRLLETNQSVMLNGAWHQLLFPSATALTKVYLVGRKVPWGAALPTSPTTNLASSGGGGLGLGGVFAATAGR